MTQRTDLRHRFISTLGFQADQFQLDAMDALDDGDSVLVVAPTGSGKTLVGEYAMAVALGEGRRAFYTTPLKALSNQKFHDLSNAYGADNVGLLTGDNSINGDAPIVVMTTEVLRNMIYAGSTSLDPLAFVVLDEVHYLQNTYRGPVWEEVIIHTPAHVSLVCLSATVSNAEELADWIKVVRGSTVPIMEYKRPVELEHHYVVTPRRQPPLMLPVFGVNGKPNTKGAEYDAASTDKPWRKTADRQRMRPPDRVDVIELLGERSMLPAIYFIFSRNGCDDAVRQTINGGIRLTTSEEREEIRAIAEAATDDLSDDDLSVLQYGEWLNALENGVAAHHAGLVTPFKEAVEACFNKALVKVVFATETLALGINMPARTVVIEKLSKFTGERHEQLTPGEYTQLTGRAGRRGIDDLGHAVVLWSQYTSFNHISSLASTRTYALTSSFRPTYNMAANLVRRYEPGMARHLLNLSFAQYRTDAEVVRLESQLDQTIEALETANELLQCDRGDVATWLAANEAANATPKADSEEYIAKKIAHLHVGDVIDDPDPTKDQQLLIITTAQRKGHDVRLGVLTPDGRRFTLNKRDFVLAPHRLSHVDLPKPYNPSNKDFVKRAAASLDNDRQSRKPVTSHSGDGPGACPDIGRHLSALDDAKRLQAERHRIETRVKNRSESLARQFDRVLSLLSDLGYVDDWSLTNAGTRLAKLYHESDLLIVECLRHGVFDDLDTPSMAAVASSLVYETRGPAGTGPAPRFQNKTIEERVEKMTKLWKGLAVREQELGLTTTKAPDPGFAEFAYAWVSGEELSEVLADESLSGGDFVRNVKQLIDLLGQLATLAPEAETMAIARRSADALLRDLVAASSVSMPAR